MYKDQHIPRILPLESPYSSEVAAALAKWMPPWAAVEALKLFRTLLQNREMSDRMRPLGAGIMTFRKLCRPVSAILTKRYDVPYN
jgi:hypothetical protein